MKEIGFSSGIKKRIIIFLVSLLVFILLVLIVLLYYLNSQQKNVLKSNNQSSQQIQQKGALYPILVTAGEKTKGKINLKEIDCPCAEGKKIEIKNLKEDKIVKENHLIRNGKFITRLPAGDYEIEIPSLLKMDFSLGNKSDSPEVVRMIYYLCQCQK